jgi:arylsulfatase A-like enzyme
MKVKWTHVACMLASVTCGATNLTADVSAEVEVLTESKPNILWIIGEDASPDLGCYGVDGVYTSNLDKLATEGMRFTRAFMTAAVCATARTALHTGMYQTAIGAHQMRTPQSLARPLPEGVRSLPDWFRRAGYFTANVRSFPEQDELSGTGKTDWMFKRGPADRFDSAKWTDLKRNQPFFAEVNFRVAHRKPGWSQADARADRQADPDTIRIPPYYPDHPVTRKDWAAYLDYVSVLDRKVGRVLERLEKDGLADNTIVVFLTDHGRPMTRGKTMLYDSGIQIPLILRWPRGIEPPAQYQAGGAFEELVSGIDLTATMLAFADIEKPAKMQGRVFMGTAVEPPRRYIHAAADRIGEFHHRVRCVRSTRYKYIRNYKDTPINEQATAYRKAMHPIHHLLDKLGRENRLSPAQQALVEPLPKEELYDLEADPFEIKNLSTAPGHQEALVELRKAMDDWLDQTDDQGLKPDSPELIAAFEAYGKKSGAQRGAIAKVTREQVEREDEAYKASLRDE